MGGQQSSTACLGRGWDALVGWCLGWGPGGDREEGLGGVNSRQGNPWVLLTCISRGTAYCSYPASGSNTPPAACLGPQLAMPCYPRIPTPGMASCFSRRCSGCYHNVLFLMKVSCRRTLVSYRTSCSSHCSLGAAVPSVSQYLRSCTVAAALQRRGWEVGNVGPYSHSPGGEAWG